ncbi:hypothetical protein OESDEN_25275 [Oesophagostomum dentatum]|uniref:Uncharacterized protein n=1 Tax=Oesophagostomum dentatum TaxID=61180 RepID=A0A0B1RR49_OESDE|nr:hypothetical protein OESDEN_25275 [Oesophagostomum dentatum]
MLASTCDMKMFFVYSNSLTRSATSKGSTKSMIIDLPYDTNSNKGHIVLEGKAGCEFELTVKPEVFHAWYQVLISNANALVHFILSALVAFTLLEKLASSKTIKQSDQKNRVGYYVNGGVIALLFFCFTYNTGIREAIITTSSFYFISCAYFLAGVVGYIRNKIFSTFPACLRLVNAVLKMFIFLLVPIRASLSYAIIALLIALVSSGLNLVGVIMLKSFFLIIFLILFL